MFYAEGGETLGQVAQGGGGCPIPGNIHGQIFSSCISYKQGQHHPVKEGWKKTKLKHATIAYVLNICYCGLRTTQEESPEEKVTPDVQSGRGDHKTSLNSINLQIYEVPSLNRVPSKFPASYTNTSARDCSLSANLRRLASRHLEAAASGKPGQGDQNFQRAKLVLLVLVTFGPECFKGFHKFSRQEDSWVPAYSASPSATLHTSCSHLHRMEPCLPHIKTQLQGAELPESAPTYSFPQNTSQMNTKSLVPGMKAVERFLLELRRRMQKSSSELVEMSSHEKNGIGLARSLPSLAPYHQKQMSTHYLVPPGPPDQILSSFYRIVSQHLEERVTTNGTTKRRDEDIQLPVNQLGQYRNSRLQPHKRFPDDNPHVVAGADGMQLKDLFKTK
ncbi:hypothetical protein QYF61_011645, partial [Mycteria americana]